MTRPCARLRKRVQSNHHQQRGDRRCLCVNVCLTPAVVVFKNFIFEHFFFFFLIIFLRLFSSVLFLVILFESVYFFLLLFLPFHISRPFCILKFNLFEEYVYETCDRKQLHLTKGTGKRREMKFYSNFLERSFAFSLIIHPKKTPETDFISTSIGLCFQSLLL